jgi:hypothetical protein
VPWWIAWTLVNPEGSRLERLRRLFPSLSRFSSRGNIEQGTYVSYGYLAGVLCSEGDIS